MTAEAMARDLWTMGIVNTGIDAAHDDSPPATRQNNNDVLRTCSCRTRASCRASSNGPSVTGRLGGPRSAMAALEARNPRAQQADGAATVQEKHSLPRQFRR